MVHLEEIKHKYSLFMKIKRMIIYLGIFTVIAFFGYHILEYKNVAYGSMVLLVLSIISFSLFLLLWTSVFTIKKYLLQLVEEYEGL